ncbi:MAG: ABC transporter ATP-binding protein [Clostridium sp.]|uniref:ABC transporter ATP-binding protein n=1 Tax=Clostridium sp. TaxID=1506 RepID=UPI002FC8A613
MLNIENLRFKHPNCKDNCIDNISFQVNEGEIISLLGESGSGKTTILRLISGLEGSVDGKITIDNVVVNDKNIFVDPSNRKVSMVFQDYALFPHMTVKDNIGFGIKKLSKLERQDKIRECLRLVRMEEYINRYPHELSGGQMQRIAIARALAIDPKILLLDEPFSNLDSNLQEAIRGELEEIIRSVGITCILVTHDREDALKISDRIINIEKGKVKSIDKIRSR